MNTDTALHFDDNELLAKVDALDDQALDQLGFGVIAFDSDGIVRRYNATETRNTRLDPQWVCGQHVFTAIAQCMNNYLVAQRFEDAAAARVALDDTILYVLTWRMRPQQVRLRMLYSPAVDLRYLLLLRLD